MRVAATAVERVFAELRARGRCALLPFFVAYYPDRVAFREALLRAEGADLIEVGVPFSDPIADGPTIRRAAASALARGARLERVLDELARLRGRLPAPPLLMTYLNPVLAYGVAKFATDACACGVAGAIVPDLEVEAAGEVRSALAARGLDLVPLAAPTSTEARLQRIASVARGFVYLVSVTGTTGVRRTLPPGLPRYLARARRAAARAKKPDLPLVVGFGIGKPETAARVARIADGVVVGSALVAAFEGAGGALAARRSARVLSAIRAAIDRARREG